MYARPKKVYKTKNYVNEIKTENHLDFCVSANTLRVWSVSHSSAGISNCEQYDFGRNLNQREKDVFKYFFQDRFLKVYEKACAVKDFGRLPPFCICDEPQASIKQHLSHSLPCHISDRFDHNFVFEEEACEEQVTCIL